jgi:catalase
VSEPVLSRVFQYWRNIDKTLGDRIERGVRTKGTDTGRPSA